MSNLSELQNGLQNGFVDNTAIAFGKRGDLEPLTRSVRAISALFENHSVRR